MRDTEENTIDSVRRQLDDALRERDYYRSEIDRLVDIQKEKQTVEHDLGERVKELNCLYSLSEIFDRDGDNIESMLDDAVKLLPISWQYPDITCGRICFEDRDHVTDGWRPSRWMQKSDIYLNGKVAGAVEVYYLERMPDAYEGPFLKEERLLIDAIASKLGRSVDRMRVKAQLELEQEALRNANIALKEILSKVQEEKAHVAESVQANVNKIIFPIIFSIESDLPHKFKQHVKLLKDNLSEITGPLTNRLSRDFLSLTPIETQICNMIRGGLASKEIASIRGISPTTVNRHRENIRKKLGLSNNKVNLASFLNTYMDTPIN